MKRRILMIISIAITLFTLASCFSLQDVKDLSINYTLKDKYNVGEEVLLDNIEVIATMTDDTEKKLKFSSDLVSKISGHRVDGEKFYLYTRDVGQFTLKISYEGVVFEVDYTVVDISEWDGVTYTAPTLSGSIYTIDKPEKMAWIAQQSALGNDFSGKTIRITADINLGSKWNAIDYLENLTIEGEEVSTGVYPTISMSGGRSFISYGSALTIRNLNFAFNINQAIFGGIVDTVWANEEFTEERVTSFTNISASGSIFVTSYGAGFIGWIDDFDGKGYTRNEKVVFTNCSNAVNMTTLGSNSGSFIGYSHAYANAGGTNQNTTVYFDNATLNAFTGQLIALKNNVGSNIGLYWGHSYSTIYVGGEKYTGNLDTIPNITYSNKTESEKFIQVAGTAFNAPSKIGEYVEVNKVAGATELIVYLQYTYGLGYPMRIINRIDISTLTLGQKIITPQKFMYVSQNPESANWLNYIYDTQYDETAASQNYYAISTTVSIYAIQVNSNNEPINAVIYNYINVPNK